MKKNFFKGMLVMMLAGCMFAFTSCDEKKDGKGSDTDSTQTDSTATSDSNTDADVDADADETATTVAHYICAMGADCGSGDEAGQCGGCGMDMVENPDWVAMNDGAEDEHAGHNH